MVGSFFENLVMIKMSVVGRVCLCLPAAQRSLLQPASSSGLCTEHGRERTRDVEVVAGDRGPWLRPGPAVPGGVHTGHLCWRHFKDFPSSTCGRSRTIMQMENTLKPSNSACSRWPQNPSLKENGSMAQGTFRELFGYPRARPAPCLEGRDAQGGPESALPGGAGAAPRHQARGRAVENRLRDPRWGASREPQQAAVRECPPRPGGVRHCTCDVHLRVRAAGRGPRPRVEPRCPRHQELRVPAASVQAFLFSTTFPRLILGCHGSSDTPQPEISLAAGG